jgi:hypothetical protein
MTETMTQEALLDLIYAYAEAREEMGTGSDYFSARREMSAAHAALLDAVRSLPIEAGR